MDPYRAQKLVPVQQPDHFAFRIVSERTCIAEDDI